MALVVFKYELFVTGSNQLTMPEGAKLLSVGEQQGATLVLWALVDPANPPEPREFTVYGTGQHGVDPHGEYVGTIQAKSGFVWHVFDITPNPRPRAGKSCTRCL